MYQAVTVVRVEIAMKQREDDGKIDVLADVQYKPEWITTEEAWSALVGMQESTRQLVKCLVAVAGNSVDAVVNNVVVKG
jgi:hypothetical protein